MGEFVHNVSTLCKVSLTESLCTSLKVGLYRRIYGSLIWAGNVFSGVPLMQRRRLAFYDFAHWMFGYEGFSQIRKINGQRYLQTPLCEDGARSLLVSLGVKSTFDVDPVYSFGDENYVLAYWHYDGGSDGREEYESFSKKVDQYFDSLPNKESRLSTAAKTVKEVSALVSFVCMAAVSLILLSSLSWVVYQDAKEEQTFELVGSETLTYKIAADLMRENLLERRVDNKVELSYRQPEGADLPALFMDMAESFNKKGLLAELLQNEASKYGCSIDGITGFTDRSVGVDFKLQFSCS